MSAAALLTPDEARLLDHLMVAGVAPAAASASGVRRARTRGRGLEFHEYRPYESGDDPRSIDWTVDARLGQLVVRVARAEGDLRLHLLLDVSASMRIGTPDKLACARRLAAGLCYVAVERRDAVGVTTFTDTVRTCLPPAAGRSQLFRAFDVLSRSRAGGRSALDRALLAYGSAVQGPGLAVVLSDFFVPGAGLEGLRYLLHRGLTPAVVAIVAPEESAPWFDTVTEIVDVEETTAAPLVVDQTVVAGYRRHLAAHHETLAGFCREHRLPWLPVASDQRFERLIADAQHAGLLSARS